MRVGKALLLTHLTCIRSHSLAGSLGTQGGNVGASTGEVVFVPVFLSEPSPHC